MKLNDYTSDGFTVSHNVRLDILIMDRWWITVASEVVSSVSVERPELKTEALYLQVTLYSCP